jgi:methylthioribose-1-phosphate isomerase
MTSSGEYKTLQWIGDINDGVIRVIDQRELPGRLVYVDLYTLDDAYLCIRDMMVRGAPAIGVVVGFC